MTVERTRKTANQASASLRLLALLLLAVGPALAAAACAPRVDVRGHVFDPDALAQIRPGQQSRDQVAEVLGTPTAVGTFDENRWLYISSQTETLAFYDPDVIEQKVVVVEFDQAGIVKEITSYTEADAQEVDPVDRKTPTKGKSLSFFEQIFGNIGAFASPERGQ
jgi:outer membrane protein assembly factor BamE (lipoprotein component of BamABCDE complex)